jgi:hypothetical protein
LSTLNVGAILQFLYHSNSGNLPIGVFSERIFIFSFRSFLFRTTAKSLVVESTPSCNSLLKNRPSEIAANFISICSTEKQQKIRLSNAGWLLRY